MYYFDDFRKADFECCSQGLCALDPSLTAIQEIILHELSQLTFYILQLKELGYISRKANDFILNFMEFQLINSTYNPNSLKDLIIDLYNKKYLAQKFYTGLMKKRKLNYQLLNNLFKINSETTISDLIHQGEHYFYQKYQIMGANKRNLLEILTLLVKYTGTLIKELSEYRERDYALEFKLFNILSLLNFANIGEHKIRRKIDELVKVTFELNQELLKEYTNYYGMQTKREVPNNVSKGPSILISGCSLKELKDILEATKDRGVNIYTYSDLIKVHTYEEFHKYPHLKGHFGDPKEFCTNDFIHFKGPILVSKHSSQRIELFIRGDIFTTDNISFSGVTQIHDKNYEPLIERALKYEDSSSSTEEENKAPIKVGYDRQEILEKIDKIFNEIASSKINLLFVIWEMNFFEINKKYINEIADKIKNDSFVISNSNIKDSDNILNLHAYGDSRIFYYITSKMESLSKEDKNKIVFILGRCDMHSLSIICKLSNIGVKNILMSKCPTVAVTPLVVKGLKDNFEVKTIKEVCKFLK